MPVFARGLRRRSIPALVAVLCALGLPWPAGASPAPRAVVAAGAVPGLPQQGLPQRDWAQRDLAQRDLPARGPTAGQGPRAGFVLPVPPPAVVLTPFRPPAVKWGAGHRGVDLAAAAARPIVAAADGVVAFAGTVVDRGVVSVSHSPALRTTYEPVTPKVRAGQRVRAGEVIGLLVAGHPSCAPRDCLHWGARIGADSYIDPMALITGLRIRLKPWDGEPG
ncbi:peptidoglycan DD-metalloendopeptidase family protein [Nakamurella sp. DB0629]|uniref:Peptidoglycan DD-metalloendopeptidase family protein n=2 Tax=Nakamurella aerolata TaxID=1656892 RepID=A0A849A3D1_9ACTN|nr:peptidoglycan DD-metalloendopeptidase family protein [Nakamurella aerolata]